jgi:hypothetical protein
LGQPKSLLYDTTDPRVTATLLHLTAWRTVVEPDLPNVMDTFLVRWSWAQQDTRG